MWLGHIVVHADDLDLFRSKRVEGAALRRSAGVLRDVIRRE
jgi:hypothetical protein